MANQIGWIGNACGAAPNEMYVNTATAKCGSCGRTVRFIVESHRVPKCSYCRGTLLPAEFDAPEKLLVEGLEWNPLRQNAVLLLL